MTIKYALRKYFMRAWAEFICFRIGASGGPCENGNELTGCISGAEFLAQLREYQLFTKSSAA